MPAKATINVDGVASVTLATIGSIVLQPTIPADQDQTQYSTGEEGMTSLVFELQNGSSVSALADFALLVQPHRASQWHTVLSGADWGTVAGILKHKEGALNTLAAGAAAMAYVDIGPVYAIDFSAQTAATNGLDNGTFTGNANGWTLGSGWAYGTNNVAATATSATMKQLKADMSTPWTDELIYLVTFTITGYSAGTLQVGTNTDPSQSTTAISANGTYSVPVTADAHADGLVFTGTGFTGVIDTVTAIEIPAIRVSGSMI